MIQFMIVIQFWINESIDCTSFRVLCCKNDDQVLMSIGFIDNYHIVWEKSV